MTGPLTLFAASDVLNSAVLVAFISTGGTVLVAYIVNVLAKKRQEKKHPDRMATIFDGYEKLIAQQQEELVRKGNTITALEQGVARLEKQLDETRELLQTARDELSESEGHTRRLQSQLNDMRKEYKLGGTETQAGR